MWYIIFAVLTIVSLYGLFLLFKKAGKQGWEAIVPFYTQKAEHLPMPRSFFSYSKPSNLYINKWSSGSPFNGL